ncbi:MAG: hypothetical protein AAFY03_05020 [Pseudomonadota bacterium]
MGKLWLEKLAAGPSPDCGCYEEEYVVNGLHLILHQEDDGYIEAYVDAGEWESQHTLLTKSISHALCAMIGWIMDLPDE